MTTRKAATPRRSTRRKPDALRMLKDDHDKVKGLFENFQNARRDEKRKGEIAQTICKELTVHTQLEEEIFYPAVREAIDDDDVMNEAVVEHGSAKELIAEIEKMSPDEDMFDAKVKVLKEEIEHHVEEEEKPKEGLFAQTREADIDLKELGERLAQRKEALQAEFKASGLPAPETTTLEQVEV